MMFDRNIIMPWIFAGGAIAEENRQPLFLITLKEQTSRNQRHLSGRIAGL